MNPKSIFDQCLTILENRQSSYGASPEAFTKIANMWNILLNDRLKENLTGRDVAMMMVLFKIMRESHSHTLDNILDSINYLVLYENNLAKEEKKDGQTTTKGYIKNS